MLQNIYNIHIAVTVLPSGGLAVLDEHCMHRIIDSDRPLPGPPKEVRAEMSVEDGAADQEPTGQAL